MRLSSKRSPEVACTAEEFWKPLDGKNRLYWKQRDSMSYGAEATALGLFPLSQQACQA